MSPLFRAEAVEAQKDKFLGTIRIAANPRYTLAMWAAILLALALLVFASTAQVTRKVRVPGLLMPSLGSLRVEAIGAGVIVEMKTKEGDEVKKGQPLFIIQIDRATANGETSLLVAQTIASRRQAIESQRSTKDLQARQRIQAIESRLRNGEIEFQQAKGELSLAKRRETLATSTAEKFQKLAKEGFVAEVQAQQKIEEQLDLQAKTQAVERSLTMLNRDAEALRAELKSTASQLQADLSQLDKEAAVLSQESIENSARGQIIVQAPIAGVVSAMSLHLGQAVQSGQTLATIIPESGAGRESALEAQLFAPSRTIGFVRIGQPVLLRYAAYPYQKFGLHSGEISSISRTPFNPQDLPAGQGQTLLAATQSNEPLYRMTVKLDVQSISAYGEQHKLRPGLSLEADVLQDRRSILEWMLEPMFAVGASSRIPEHARKAGPDG
ncbi:HlyD family secretion protein [Piscinibacter terrae]|uniref:HlyD family efflux transporter periplasmic adaptor subunit n=1 Tax=Piscinibacter terrae TaxID=2496871 RepID=A0A3N7HT63_9BURK|nr:HlyD family efflux transporter periplasmic adaptor subunit [Albitalea terrae]RQP25414.1 HlyD family efflux transporter periplasmic adaptor subunit [Albitalea terrae]